MPDLTWPLAGIILGGAVAGCVVYMSVLVGYNRWERWRRERAERRQGLRP
jgi:uncharacterized integral membrane protein